MGLLLLFGGGVAAPPPPPLPEVATAGAFSPPGLPVLSAGAVTIRHISKGTGVGSVTVLGASFVPQRRQGINGTRGFQRGQWERTVNDEGTATLTLPNTAGDDGILHRRRFACFTDPGYHTGDEWLEIETDHGVRFVGTPNDRDRSRSTLTLELVDALWMLNTQRETAAGFWAHAPRDAIEHYTRAWAPVVADDFDAGADPAKWTAVGSTVDGDGFVAVSGGESVTARADYWGEIDLASQRAWRLEATLVPSFTTVSSARLSLVTAAGTERVGIGLTKTRTSISTTGDDALVDEERANDDPNRPTILALAIEGRDRWVHFYLNGRLIGGHELDITTTAPVVPRLAVSGSPGSAVLHQLLLRRADPYLMRGADKGDYRLPGLLPAGGLRGSYFDEADLRTLATAPRFRRLLAPTRAPYARRQDPTINFTGVKPATWQPAGPFDGECFSVRWTGAIYLDLAAADVTLRLTGLNDGARLYVGRTMYGDELIESWTTGTAVTLTSGSLRTHLGTSASGWYPLRLEYAQVVGDAGIILQRSVGGAAYEVVPEDALSPFGCYEAQVRYDSHAEQLKAIATAFGLQYVCEPRSLESGEFPGAVVPRVRVGRDTDKVLTPAESTEASIRESSSEVVDTLYADAAGLGDQANAAQLTAESVNFAALAPGEHMMIASAYESLADITDPILLQTRLASLLGLRVTTWQEVAARPRGHQEIRNAFPIPLTADLALFAWEPGDGIRLQDEALDLEDETPRQMISVTWPFVPGGLGAPSVRFRQRPRTQQDALRTLVRATLLPQRNYQGQLAVVAGSQALTGGAGNYSRVMLPRDLADVVRCELVVFAKGDTTTWTIRDYPAAVSIGTFETTGRIDLIAYLARYNGTAPAMVVDAVGGTGTAQYQLELVVRI